MELAVRILGAVLGFIAAVTSYQFFDDYVWALVALVASVALGLVVYGVVCAVANVAAFRSSRRL